MGLFLIQAQNVPIPLCCGGWNVAMFRSTCLCGFIPRQCREVVSAPLGAGEVPRSPVAHGGLGLPPSSCRVLVAWVRQRGKAWGREGGIRALNGEKGRLPCVWERQAVRSLCDILFKAL